MSTHEVRRATNAKRTRRDIWNELSHNESKVLALAPKQWKVVLVVAILLGQGAGNVVYPLVIREAVDATFGRDVTLAVWMAGTLVAVSLLWNVLSVCHRMVAANVGYSLLGGLQIKTFDHLLELPLVYYTDKKKGHIQDKVTENFSVARAVFVTGTTQWLHSATACLGAAAVLYFLDWRVFAAAVPLAAAILWLTVGVGRRLAESAREIRKASKELSTVAGEALTPRCVIVNRTLGSAMQRQIFCQSTGIITRRTKKIDVDRGLVLAPVDLAVTAIVASVIVFVAETAVHGEPIMSAGTLLAINAGLLSCLYHLQAMVSKQLELSGLLGRIEEAFDILRTPIQIAPGERALPPNTGGKVTFNEVTYRYPSATRLALDRVAFEIPPGQRFAVVGETGSGKTTLAHCLARLIDPDEGTVSIDGTDLRDLSRDSLRTTVGLVSQDPALIHGTVAENIRWGLEVSDKEIEAAARLARIHDDLISLPDGFDTLVGADGAELSGGQRQRIHIARVALRRPRVLILDEATSSLDPITEIAVDQALRNLQEGTTTLVVAHRLSTVKHADQILVIKDGEIVDQGTHLQLMRRGGHYANQVVASLRQR